MLPHGADAAQPGRDYHGAMARPAAALAAALAVLAALPARAQGPLEPSGRLPPVTPPDEASPGKPPRKAVPAEPRGPSAPLPRGAVLEQVTGTVREVDRKAHKIVVDSGGEAITLAMDRNTMVYTSGGLGTVLDVVPGTLIRAGRNAEFVAYWVQIRPAPGKARPTPAPSPGQGTGPAGSSGPPAETTGTPTPPGGGGNTSTVTPGPGPGGGQP
jgi:hypothetical protein